MLAAENSISKQSFEIRWMPAEKINNSEVVNSTSGHRIVKPEGRQFRLYGPDKKLLGVFSTQADAEAFADKKK